MSILDKCNIRTDDMHLRRPEDPQEVTATLTQVEDNSAPKFNGFTNESAYRTSIQLHTTWYANDAQFRGREQLARKELLHFMYGPVLHRLHEIRARVADRDFMAAMRVVDEIERELVA